jgi:four helix bundle protein
MIKENILKQKSFDFAVRIVKLYKYLKKENNEFVLSQQIVSSGTSIGALIREAEHAESKKDFLHKITCWIKRSKRNCVLA